MTQGQNAALIIVTIFIITMSGITVHFLLKYW